MGHLGHYSVKMTKPGTDHYWRSSSIDSSSVEAVKGDREVRHPSALTDEEQKFLEDTLQEIRYL